MAEIQKPAETTAPKSDTVKVRVKQGRILIGRERVKLNTGRDNDFETLDKFATKGDVIEMGRAEAEKLLARAFDGYPGPDGCPGKMSGVVRDSPIELVM